MMGDSEAELEVRLENIGKRLGCLPSDLKELLFLLEEAEYLLLKVEQSPSTSMSTALRPAMKALVAKDLLGHLDIDVKVAVASCVSEITRITAPEAPYDDDLMQDVFGLIVEAFKGLDEISSPSYNRRVSILETVAKVRSCVVMLDLEFDNLILEMFQHFFVTIRNSHSENVFSLMVTIMTLVLEESEDISQDLLGCLLASVKNDKDVLPIARTLGEKVIGNCSKKLKPTFLEAIQSMGAHLSDYSRIVALICQEDSGLHKTNDSKFGECVRHGGMEMEVGCSGFVNAASRKSSKGPTKNGTIHTAYEKSLDNLKKNSEVPDREKKHSEHGFEAKLIKRTGKDVEKKPKLQHTSRSNNKNISIASPTAGDGTHDLVRTKRGRPPGSKNVSNRGINTVASKGPAIDKQVGGTSDSEDKPLSHLSKRVLTKKVKDGKSPSVDIHLKKDSEIISDTDAKSPNLSGGKKNKAVDLSTKLSTHRGKLQTKSITSEKDAEGRETLKETISTPKIGIKSREESNSKGNLKMKASNKHVKLTDKMPKSPQGVKNLDEKLIGASIRVWWPEDKKFYHGIIDSYSQYTKKHKVLYDDGDVEVLLLKNERWEIANDDKLSDEDGVVATNSSKMPSKKKAKTDSNSVMKKAKSDRETSIVKLKEDVPGPIGGKFGTESIKSSKVKAETPKTTTGSQLPSPKTGIKGGTLKKENKPSTKSKNSDVSEAGSDSMKVTKEGDAKSQGVGTPKPGSKSNENGDTVKASQSTKKRQRSIKNDLG